MALQPMRYKTFTWPNNPVTCIYTCEKTIIKHKYPELQGAELEDLDPDAAIISCSGEFFRLNAYRNWDHLNRVFRDRSPGEFYHPVFKDVTVAIMKNLRASLEPREHYVAYTFEIWQHSPPIIVTKSTVDAGTDTQSLLATGGGRPKVGDIVIANGYVHRSSDGLGRGIKLVDKRTTVTHTNYDVSWSTKPVHVGTYGWMALTDVKLPNSTAGTKSGDTIVVVKPGDTLSGICARYGVNWRDVATHNGIKNPHLIYVGQKINIKVG